MSVEILCECSSLCRKTVALDAGVYGDFSRQGLVIIVNGCKHGPEPTDVLVEEREGYKLYKGHDAANA